MATRIVCNHTTCKHNYNSWCSKDKIELVWIPPMAVPNDGKQYEGSMMCADKERVGEEGLVAQSG